MSAGAGFKVRASRGLLAVLVLAAAVGLIWYRRLPTDAESPAPSAAPGPGSTAEMVIRDFRHVETRMDRTVWVLEAQSAEVFGDDARLHTVKVAWYGDEGSVPVVVTSQEGRIDLRTRDASLSGAVRLERADGAVLLTERLSWDERRKLLRAPRAVEISTPSFSFRGTSLVANVEKQWVKLRGRVEGEVRELPRTPSRPS